MLSPASDLKGRLARVESFAPQVRAARDEMDRQAQLPLPLLKEMLDAGLFRLWLPEELGGYSVDPPIALKVIEAMARIDGSAGWCMGPGNVSGIFAAYLPETAAREIYSGDWLMNGAGSIAGSGTAIPVEGGYRLNGRWACCTNSPGCSWYLGIFTVLEEGKPRHLENGAPDLRIFYFPADKTEIVPTWDTGGLRGTGSHNLLLQEAVVGVEFGYSLQAAKTWVASPMYAAGSKIWSQTAFAAVALGIAKSAIETLIEIAKSRVPTMGSAPLCEKPVVRDELARADAALSAAESFFEHKVQYCNDKLNQGQQLSERDAAQLGQSCSHLADTSRDVAQTMYRLGGGASVYRDCTLDRCLRDVQVAAQHAAIGPRNYEAAARTMLGMT